MIDFRMKTFLTVCECMNFTRAAQVLNLTQPAVSQHIRYLEEQYDTPLFIREKKKLYLTDAGQILKDSLETLQSDDHRMKIRMQKKGTDLWRYYDNRRIRCHSLPCPLFKSPSTMGDPYLLRQYSDTSFSPSGRNS